MLPIGRRWGKTMWSAIELYTRALRVKGDYFWVAPTADVARIGWDMWHQLLPPRAYRERKSENLRVLPNGSQVFFRSAERPDLLRGRGLSGLVIDEASDVDPEAWNFSLAPALADKRGWAIVIGTPRGRNWFFDLFRYANDPEHKDWYTHPSPSADNPYISSEEIERARDTLPERVFQQEFEAQFLQDGQSVFRGVSECLFDPDTLPPPPQGTPCVIGVDLAKHRDFTVVLQVTLGGRILHMDRFTRIPWPTQRARINAFVRRHAPGSQVFVDATGVGDAVYDDLKVNTALRLIPVKFNSAKKQEVIDQLMVDIEQQNLLIPSTPRVIRDELEAYTFTVLPSQSIRYHAPPGLHDDVVMALALANYGRRKRRSFVAFVGGNRDDPVQSVQPAAVSG